MFPKSSPPAREFGFGATALTLSRSFLSSLSFRISPVSRVSVGFAPKCPLTVSSSNGEVVWEVTYMRAGLQSDCVEKESGVQVLVSTNLRSRVERLGS